MKRLAIFDLDGTLTDSAEGIYNCIRYALDKKGVPVPGDDVLKLFIGPPIVDSLREHCGMTDEEAEETYGYFRERYLPVGKFENAVYDGIPELLFELKAAGVYLGIATAKPQAPTMDILRHFDLLKYFSVVKGARNEINLVHKRDILGAALEACEAEGILTSTRYMIGDRRYDMEAAVALNCIPIGVSYGFGAREELKSASAVVVCDTPAEVGAYVLRGV